MNALPGSVDVLVIGGGINGCGIARDAAGRGLSVLLAEQDDLASHTSSASTKLVHGGLRYVELYEFRLVRHALKEREVLLATAPHLVTPLRFVMPHDEHLRPRWMIRIGLFLYDHLARRRRLPASSSVDLRSHVAGAPLDPRYTHGFAYSDAWTDDARLVVASALDARERGATVLTRTRVASARREGGRWRARLQLADGTTHELDARAIVNAAGPWVDVVERSLGADDSELSVRLVKGSHIVVRKLFDHPYAYIFQNPDGRIIFAIPYERDFTLIGTTDLEYQGDPARVKIDLSEIEYLCAMADRYFRRAVTPADVVSTYSGVRPLLDDRASNPSKVTRDYTLELDAADPPLLSVYGGKITTFRRLAEDALDRLAPRLGSAARAWTARSALPGGDLPRRDLEAFEHALATRHPWLPPALARRYAHAYGSRAARILGNARSLEGLGAAVLPGLHEAEIDYLVREEWAVTAEDILWRRSKLGLHLPAGSEAALDAWLAQVRTRRSA